MIEFHRGKNHVPFRVTAKMTEPVVYLGDLLHLDGILAAAAFRDLDERTRGTIEPVDAAEWPIDLGIPLSVWSVEAPDGVDPRLTKSRSRIRAGHRRYGKLGCPPGDDRRLWGWCASAADDSAWLARGVMEVRKKPALSEMRRYTTATSVNLGAGPMKAYDLKMPTVIALEVEWFAHGDPDETLRLLSTHITAIGKKRGIGGGAVDRWSVDRIDDDRSVVCDGKPTRRLPVGAAEGRPGHGGIRPPYYHHTRAVAAVEP